MKGYYKVPRRDVYCRTVRQWLGCSPNAKVEAPQ